MATQSWVNREYRRGLRMQYQRGGNVVAYPHHLGAARQEVQYPVAQGGLGGHYGVKCRAVVDEQHSHIGIPLVQMG